MEPLEPHSLTTLSPGIINRIVGYLPSNDRLILRRVSRLFGTFVSRPTRTELLDLELGQDVVGGRGVNRVRCGYCKTIGEVPHCFPGMGLCGPCSEAEYPTKPNWPTGGKESGSSTLVSLPELPQNALSAVVSYLDTRDRMKLRCVSRFFQELIHRPTHDDILAAELEAWAIDKDLFACGGCVRLRQRSEFGYRLVSRSGSMWDGEVQKDWNFDGWRALYHGGPEAQNRYCNDCGKRDLPGDFRYPLGCHWLFDDKELGKTEDFVRCKHCRRVTNPKDGIYNGYGYFGRLWPHGKKEYFSNALDPTIPRDIWRLKQHFGKSLMTTLPVELIISITKHLRLDEVMLLRGVSRFFHSTIARPTHQQLLKAETEGWAVFNLLLTCGGCLRLRDEDEFSSKFMMSGVGNGKLVYPGFRNGEVKAAQRFCHECGVRPLPGEFRYWLGAHFYDERGKNGLMVRCERCGLDRPTPQRRRNPNTNRSFGDYEVGLCEPCLIQQKGRGFLTFMPKRTWQLSKLEGLSTGLTKRIIGHLEFPDRMALRLVSWNMNFGIPLLAHHELVLAEQEEWAEKSRVLTCGGCVRLRHESKFDLKMIMESQSGHQDFGMHRGGKEAHLRFCHDCAATDLAEKSRIRLGDRWYDKADGFDLDKPLDFVRIHVAAGPMVELT